MTTIRRLIHRRTVEDRWAREFVWAIRESAIVWTVTR